MPQPVENRLGESVFCLFSENSFFQCFRLLLYIQFLHQTTLTSQTLNASRRLSLAKKGHFKLNSQFSKLEKWVASDTSCACCSLISSLAYFYFPLFWGMVMYDNQFETKENNIYTKIKLNQDIIIRVNVYASNIHCTCTEKNVGLHFSYPHHTSIHVIHVPNNYTIHNPLFGIILIHRRCKLDVCVCVSKCREPTFLPFALRALTRFSS